MLPSGLSERSVVGSFAETYRIGALKDFRSPRPRRDGIGGGKCFRFFIIPFRHTASRPLIFDHGGSLNLGLLWVNRALAIQPQRGPLSAVAPISDKPRRSLFVRKVPTTDSCGPDTITLRLATLICNKAARHPDGKVQAGRHQRTPLCCAPALCTHSGKSLDRSSLSMQPQLGHRRFRRQPELRTGSRFAGRQKWN